MLSRRGQPRLTCIRGLQTDATDEGPAGGAAGHLLRVAAWAGAFLITAVAVLAAAGHYKSAAGPPAAGAARARVQPQITTIASALPARESNGKVRHGVQMLRSGASCVRHSTSLRHACTTCMHGMHADLIARHQQH